MINIIAAVDQNMGLGRNNELLAHISPDLKYFKKKTKGSTVVMGYNTYLSLPVKPLPNRKNIVLTSKNIKLPNCTVMNNIEEVLKYSNENKKENIFIIGGESIYRQFIEHADILFLTHIFEEFEDVDVYFPNIEDWKLIRAFGSNENLKHKYKHIFAIYTKKQP